MFRYRWWKSRYIAVGLTELYGPWFSLGFHLSFKPPELDIHFLWFIIQLTTREHANWICEQEAAYEEDV